ncbi:hypothetical protein ACOSP7_021368 [Xanthoceras sorbifolium]
MAEAVITVATEQAVQPLVDSISTQLGYIWNYKTNFDNLEKEVQKLQGRREAMKHRVEEATRNGEEIEQQVVNWLDSVNKMIDEAAEIIDENKQASMKCFKRLCPDLKKRYQHSKKAAGKAEDVVRLREDGKFDRVSYRTPPKETWHPSNKLYEDFESRRSTVENILNALRNPDTNMVGVYGMGGVGKTTLVREVGKQAEEQRLFVAVVFVEVSEKPDTRKIQGEIADKLGLEFREETESGRARKLCERLKKESTILLILDNIWKGLDMDLVGIPFGNEHPGCACIEQHNLQSLAFEVAKRCGGLPIAIVTIAKALKDKQEHAWRNALGELKRPSSENLEGSVTAEAYSCIHLSYNHLETNELKSTFLLCSTMGFTSEASIEDLLRYGMGLNIFRTVRTMEEARDRVNTLVQKLKDCSLLLDTPPNGGRLSIHDVVRDVGRSIAFKDHNQFTVIDGIIPCGWKEKNILKSCTSIYLHDITELPNKELDCPLLKFLYMKGRNEYSKIPDNFFTGMLNLRVLHLRNMEQSPLLTSLRCLVNLRTLCLNCSWLRDMDFIVDMKDLEILVLSCGTIEQLPVEIGQLIQLRVLDLSECYGLEVIPPNIISRLTKLEELYMSDEFDKWHVEGVDNESKNVSLDELKHLSQLTTLHIRIFDYKIVPKGFFSHKLQRYKICVGVSRWESYSPYKTPRLLKLKYDDVNLCVEDGVVKQLKGIEGLHLIGKQSVKNVLYQLDRDGFPQLKHFESEPCVAFPHLETLSLSNLNSLEKICDGQLPPNSFCQLRTIKVKDCVKLKNTFFSSVSRHLSQLQDIEVEEVASTSDQERQIHDIPRPLFDRKVKFHNLKTLKLYAINSKYVFSSSTLGSFVQLQDLHIRNCKLFTFQENTPKDRLDISIQPLPLVKKVFCNLEELMLDGNNTRMICKAPFPKILFPKLKLLTIKGDKSTDLPLEIFQRFHNLERLSLLECSGYKEIFLCEEAEKYIQIKNLFISGLENLKQIWKQDCEVNAVLQNLENLDVEECNSLVTLIPPSTYFQNLTILRVSFCYGLLNLVSSSTAKSLVRLTEMTIEFCNMITEVVADNGGRTEDHEINFSKLKSLELFCLSRLTSFSSLNCTFNFPSLEELTIEGCPKMKIFTSGVMITPMLGEINLDSKRYCCEGDINTTMQQIQEKLVLSSEKLSLSGREAKMILQKFPQHQFSKLKRLVVFDDESTVLSFSMLRRFHNLEELKLIDSSYKEILLCEEVEKYAGTLVQLKSLDLDKLDDLEQLWKEDSKLDLILQNLETLEVNECNSLMTLMPASASFQNLKSLEIWRCKGLISLVSPSTAKTLVQLKEMRIGGCDVMTEIVANGDVKEDNIVFSKLESLQLIGLSSLTSFCSANYALNFPSLNYLRLLRCPKMKLFSSGVLNTPMLQQIERDFDEYIWEVDLNTEDLNTTIQRMYEALNPNSDCAGPSTQHLE